MAEPLIPPEALSEFAAAVRECLAAYDRLGAVMREAVAELAALDAELEMVWEEADA